MNNVSTAYSGAVPTKNLAREILACKEFNFASFPLVDKPLIFKIANPHLAI